MQLEKEISDSFLTVISLKAGMLVDIKCFDSFLSLLIRMDFDSLNNWSRVSFQQNLFLALTSFLTGCLIGLME